MVAESLEQVPIFIDTISATCQFVFQIKVFDELKRGEKLN